MQNAPHEPSATDSQPTFSVPTHLSIANSSASTQVQAADGIVAHPIPTLDGFGLLIVVALLGIAALWIWRRQQ